MTFEKLTLRSVDLRPALVPLKRPVVSRVGLFDQWPLILIDLYTEEGIVGRSYLEPYEALRSLHRPRDTRSGRGAQGAAHSATRRFSEQPQIAQSRRVRGRHDDRRGGPG